MRYLLLMYGEASGAEDALLRERALRDATGAGEWVDGAAVAHAALARTVRVHDGVVDTAPGPAGGPPGRALTGFWLVDCEDVARAVELAARLPEARAAAVEVRPLLAPSGMEM